MHQQHPVHPQYSHQQAQHAQSNNWQSGVGPPQMYKMAHSSSSVSVGSSLLVRQPQLQIHQVFSRSATPSTRAASSANGSASSPSLDQEGAFSDSAAQEQLNISSSDLKTAAPSSAATAGSGGGSLYACTPPGRPPGRRLGVVRWVQNQRALWREGQLTPVQRQYMTILGMQVLPALDMVFVRSWWKHQRSWQGCAHYVARLCCRPVVGISVLDKALLTV